jgi:hypothetical protein
MFMCIVWRVVGVPLALPATPLMCLFSLLCSFFLVLKGMPERVNVTVYVYGIARYFLRDYRLVLRTSPLRQINENAATRAARAASTRLSVSCRVGCRVYFARS